MTEKSNEIVFKEIISKNFLLKIFSIVLFINTLLNSVYIIYVDGFYFTDCVIFLSEFAICALLYMSANSFRASYQTKDIDLAKKGLKLISCAVILLMIIVLYYTYLDMPRIMLFLQLRFSS